ncbi:GntR family transcriptional regulator [Streptomyces sp. NPDC048290]|uniref:GntR family transcriptional regulator n=1 Tax=Streptomyces sp. NPDC048290 TaxID=3155811 RepID=UPI00342BA471
MTAPPPHPLTGSPDRVPAKDPDPAPAGPGGPGAPLALTSAQSGALRADLALCARLPRPRFTSAAAVANDAAVLRERLDRWVPFARTCRTAEIISLTATARWDELLTAAEHRPTGPASTDSVILLRAALRQLLRAIDSSAAPGLSISELTEHFTTGISSGRYLPGTVLSRTALTKALGCPRERLTDVLTDLTADSILDRRGPQQLVVPVPEDGPQTRARYIAGRLTAQIAAGLYPPGTRLPTTSGLGRLFLCGADPVRAALQLLAGKGLLQVPGKGGALVLAPALGLPPPPRSAPPAAGPGPRDDDVLLPDYVRRQWRNRRSVPAENLTGQWERLRILAAAVPAQDSGRDGLLLTELASAPLPDPPWLRPWHLAVLAAALVTARRAASPPAAEVTHPYGPDQPDSHTR